MLSCFSIYLVMADFVFSIVLLKVDIVVDEAFRIT